MAATPPDQATAPRDDVLSPATSPDRSHRLRALVGLIVTALVVALLLKTFVVQAFSIPSTSMEPTLAVGDRILVCRICVTLGGVDRGDVIVFSDPAPDGDRGVVSSFVRWLTDGLGVTRPAEEDFVKRLIALPGDVVEIDRGLVYVNGSRVDEPYLHPEMDTRPFAAMTVPPGMLFVLGDNRTRSGDSRFPPPSGLGLVPEDAVIGTAVVRVWPPGRWGGV